MYSVSRLIHFCYGHRLLNYQGKCRNLHGHNGKVEVRLSRKTLGPTGMVMDFEEIKQTLEAWIYTTLDHRMILNKKDPLIPVLRKFGQPLVLLSGNPTAEAIARHIYNQARQLKLPVAQVRLWETPSSFAEYQG